MAIEIRYTYHRLRRKAVVYRQWLVLDRPDVKVLLLEQYDGDNLEVGDQMILQGGAPIVWYVFPEKWHDVGRFHLGDETLTGWYTNLTTPVEMHGDAWSATDLFLDLWQPSGAGPQWLDQDEFDQAVRVGVVDRVTRQRVLNERTLIDLQVKSGAWPPAVARDIDLTQARKLKQM